MVTKFNHHYHHDNLKQPPRESSSSLSQPPIILWSYVESDSDSDDDNENIQILDEQTQYDSLQKGRIKCKPSCWYHLFNINRSELLNKITNFFENKISIPSQVPLFIRQDNNGILK